MSGAAVNNDNINIIHHETASTIRIQTHKHTPTHTKRAIGYVTFHTNNPASQTVYILCVPRGRTTSPVLSTNLATNATITTIRQGTHNYSATFAFSWSTSLTLADAEGQCIIFATPTNTYRLWLATSSSSTPPTAVPGTQDVQVQIDDIQTFATALEVALQQIPDAVAIIGDLRIPTSIALHANQFTVTIPNLPEHSTLTTSTNFHTIAPHAPSLVAQTYTNAHSLQFLLTGTTGEVMDGAYWVISIATETFDGICVYCDVHGTDAEPPAHLQMSNLFFARCDTIEATDTAQQVCDKLAAFHETLPQLTNIGSTVAVTTDTPIDGADILLDRWVTAPTPASRRLFLSLSGTLPSAWYFMRAAFSETTLDVDVQESDFFLQLSSNTTARLYTSPQLQPGSLPFARHEYLHNQHVVLYNDELDGDSAACTSAQHAYVQHSISPFQVGTTDVPYWVIASAEVDGGTPPYELVVLEHHDVDAGGWADIIVPVDVSVEQDGSQWLLVVPTEQAHKAHRLWTRQVQVVASDANETNSIHPILFDMSFIPPPRFVATIDDATKYVTTCENVYGQVAVFVDDVASHAQQIIHVQMDREAVSNMRSVPFQLSGLGAHDYTTIVSQTWSQCKLAARRGTPVGEFSMHQVLKYKEFQRIFEIPALSTAVFTVFQPPTPTLTWNSIDTPRYRDRIDSDTQRLLTCSPIGPCSGHLSHIIAIHTDVAWDPSTHAAWSGDTLVHAADTPIVPTSVLHNRVYVNGYQDIETGKLYITIDLRVSDAATFMMNKYILLPSMYEAQTLALWWGQEGQSVPMNIAAASDVQLRVTIRGDSTPQEVMERTMQTITDSSAFAWTRSYTTSIHALEITEGETNGDEEANVHVVAQPDLVAYGRYTFAHAPKLRMHYGIPIVATQHGDPHNTFSVIDVPIYFLDPPTITTNIQTSPYVFQCDPAICSSQASTSNICETTITNPIDIDSIDTDLVCQWEDQPSTIFNIVHTTGDITAYIRMKNTAAIQTRHALQQNIVWVENGERFIVPNTDAVYGWMFDAVQVTIGTSNTYPPMFLSPSWSYIQGTTTHITTGLGPFSFAHNHPFGAVHVSPNTLAFLSKSRTETLDICVSAPWQTDTVVANGRSITRLTIEDENTSLDGSTWKVQVGACKIYIHFGTIDGETHDAWHIIHVPESYAIQEALLFIYEKVSAIEEWSVRIASILPDTIGTCIMRTSEVSTYTHGISWRTSVTTRTGEYDENTEAMFQVPNMIVHPSTAFGVSLRENESPLRQIHTSEWYNVPFIEVLDIHHYVKDGILEGAEIVADTTVSQDGILIQPVDNSNDNDNTNTSTTISVSDALIEGTTYLMNTLRVQEGGLESDLRLNGWFIPEQANIHIDDMSAQCVATDVPGGTLIVLAGDASTGNLFTFTHHEEEPRVRQHAALGDDDTWMEAALRIADTMGTCISPFPRARDALGHIGVVHVHTLTVSVKETQESVYEADVPDEPLDAEDWSCRLNILSGLPLQCINITRLADIETNTEISSETSTSTLATLMIYVTNATADTYLHTLPEGTHLTKITDATDTREAMYQLDLNNLTMTHHLHGATFSCGGITVAFRIQGEPPLASGDTNTNTEVHLVYLESVAENVPQYVYQAIVLASLPNVVTSIREGVDVSSLFTYRQQNHNDSISNNTVDNNAIQEGDIEIAFSKHAWQSLQPQRHANTTRYKVYVTRWNNDTFEEASVDPILLGMRMRPRFTSIINPSQQVMREVGGGVVRYLWSEGCGGDGVVASIAITRETRIMQNTSGLALRYGFHIRPPNVQYATLHEPYEDANIWTLVPCCPTDAETAVWFRDNDNIVSSISAEPPWFVQNEGGMYRLRLVEDNTDMNINIEESVMRVTFTSRPRHDIIFYTQMSNVLTEGIDIAPSTTHIDVSPPSATQWVTACSNVLRSLGIRSVWVQRTPLSSTTSMSTCITPALLPPTTWRQLCTNTIHPWPSITWTEPHNEGIRSFNVPYQQQLNSATQPNNSQGVRLVQALQLVHVAAYRDQHATMIIDDQENIIHISMSEWQQYGIPLRIGMMYGAGGTNGIECAIHAPDGSVCGESIFADVPSGKIEYNMPYYMSGIVCTPCTEEMMAPLPNTQWGTTVAKCIGTFTVTVHDAHTTHTVTSPTIVVWKDLAINTNTVSILDGGHLYYPFPHDDDKDGSGGSKSKIIRRPVWDITDWSVGGIHPPRPRDHTWEVNVPATFLSTHAQMVITDITDADGHRYIPRQLMEVTTSHCTGSPLTTTTYFAIDSCAVYKKTMTVPFPWNLSLALSDASGIRHAITPHTGCIMHKYVPLLLSLPDNPQRIVSNAPISTSFVYTGSVDDKERPSLRATVVPWNSMMSIDDVCQKADNDVGPNAPVSRRQWSLYGDICGHVSHVFSYDDNNVSARFKGWIPHATYSAVGVVAEPGLYIVSITPTPITFATLSHNWIIPPSESGDIDSDSDIDIDSASECDSANAMAMYQRGGTLFHTSASSTMYFDVQYPSPTAPPAWSEDVHEGYTLVNGEWPPRSATMEASEHSAWVEIQYPSRDDAATYSIDVVESVVPMDVRKYTDLTHTLRVFPASSRTAVQHEEVVCIMNVYDYTLRIIAAADSGCVVDEDEHVVTAHHAIGNVTSVTLADALHVACQCIPALHAARVTPLPLVQPAAARMQFMPMHHTNATSVLYEGPLLSPGCAPCRVAAVRTGRPFSQVIFPEDAEERNVLRFTVTWVDTSSGISHSRQGSWICVGRQQSFAATKQHSSTTMHDEVCVPEWTSSTRVSVHVTDSTPYFTPLLLAIFPPVGRGMPTRYVRCVAQPFPCYGTVQLRKTQGAGRPWDAVDRARSFPDHSTFRWATSDICFRPSNNSVLPSGATPSYEIRVSCILPNGTEHALTKWLDDAGAWASDADVQMYDASTSTIRLSFSRQRNEMTNLTWLSLIGLPERWHTSVVSSGPFAFTADRPLRWDTRTTIVKICVKVRLLGSTQWRTFTVYNPRPAQYDASIVRSSGEYHGCVWDADNVHRHNTFHARGDVVRDDSGLPVTVRFIPRNVPRLSTEIHNALQWNTAHMFAQHPPRDDLYGDWWVAALPGYTMCITPASYAPVTVIHPGNVNNAETYIDTARLSSVEELLGVTLQDEDSGEIVVFGTEPVVFSTETTVLDAVIIACEAIGKSAVVMAGTIVRVPGHLAAITPTALDVERMSDGGWRIRPAHDDFNVSQWVGTGIQWSGKSGLQIAVECVYDESPTLSSSINDSTHVHSSVDLTPATTAEEALRLIHTEISRLVTTYTPDIQVDVGVEWITMRKWSTDDLIVHDVVTTALLLSHVGENDASSSQTQDSQAHIVWSIADVYSATCERHWWVLPMQPVTTNDDTGQGSIPVAVFVLGTSTGTNFVSHTSTPFQLPNAAHVTHLFRVSLPIQSSRPMQVPLDVDIVASAIEESVVGNAEFLAQWRMEVTSRGVEWHAKFEGVCEVPSKKWTSMHVYDVPSPQLTLAEKPRTSDMHNDARLTNAAVISWSDPIAGRHVPAFLRLDTNDGDVLIISSLPSFDDPILSRATAKYHITCLRDWNVMMSDLAGIVSAPVSTRAAWLLWLYTRHVRSMSMDITVSPPHTTNTRLSVALDINDDALADVACPAPHATMAYVDGAGVTV